MTSYTPNSNYPYPDATDAVTDFPATNATLVGYLDNLPNRSAIINNRFDIWQRGTTFSSPATGIYTADRWRLDYDGAGGTRAIYRNTISLGTNLPSGIQGNHFLELHITSAGTATTQSISQRIESVRTFASETVTLSAWVRNADDGLGVNTVTLKAIQNFGTGGSPSTAVTTTIGSKSVTGSWTRITATFTLPSLSGKTVGSNGDDYLQIMFDLGSQTGRFHLWGVQLEKNSTATALERRPIQQELALCQRYFVKSYEIGTAPGTSTNNGSFRQFTASDAYSNAWAMINLPVPLRASPALAIYTHTGTADRWTYQRSGTAEIVVPVAGALGSATTTFWMYFAVGAAWANTWLIGHYTLSSEL